MHLLEPGHAGYVALESSERAITRKTLDAFSDHVETWLKGLDLYFAMMREKRNLTDIHGDARFALVTRMTYFGLGLGHSKSALDAACRGDYHHAYFSFRYLAELLLESVYLRLRPHEAKRWHPQHASGTSPVFKPKFASIFATIKSCLPPEEKAELAMVKLVYDIAKDMDASGAHPSHEVLVQAMVQVDDRIRMGSRFEPSRCLGALDRGLLLTLLLLAELLDDETELREERMEQVKNLMDMRRTLMQPYWDKSSA